MSGIVVIVGCSEYRGYPQLEECLSTEYGDVEFERILLPGGLGWPARAAGTRPSRVERWLTAGARNKAWDALRWWFGHREVLAIELLAHEGCTWYRREYRNGSAGELVRLQGNDLLETVRAARDLGDMTVRARFATGSGIERIL